MSSHAGEPIKESPSRVGERDSPACAQHPWVLLVMSQGKPCSDERYESEQWFQCRPALWQQQAGGSENSRVIADFFRDLQPHQGVDQIAQVVEALFVFQAGGAHHFIGRHAFVEPAHQQGVAHGLGTHAGRCW